MSSNHPWYNHFHLSDEIDVDFVRAVQVSDEMEVGRRIARFLKEFGESELRILFSMSGTEVPEWLLSDVRSKRILAVPLTSVGEPGDRTILSYQWYIASTYGTGDDLHEYNCVAKPGDWIVKFKEHTLAVIPDVAFKKLFREGFKVESS